MDNKDTKDKAIEAFGPILIKQGYDWVELDDVAKTASIELKEIKHAFANKALLCQSWMELTDIRARKHHAELLSSGKSMRQVLDQYFEELESFMIKFGFSGCPFANTSRAIRGRSEPEIENRIKAHKEEIRQFFLKLCRKGNFSSDILGEALFLLYSGATTESANMQNIKPVTSGREASMALFDLYAS